MAKNRWPTWLLLAGAAVGECLGGSGSVALAADRDDIYQKQPEAIAVLRETDRAIRELHGITYRADYLGAFTSRGRVSSDVVLRREAGVDQAMQSIAYAARIEVRAEDAPYAQGHYPQHYTLVELGGQTRLYDPAEGTMQRADGQARRRLNYGALTSGVLPQYLRSEPLQLEIEESIGASYLGTAPAGGKESHVVWLRFDKESGLGEQLLYIGVEDHLLRKVTLVAPETPLTGVPGGAPASNPSIFIELTMREVEVQAALPDSAFEVAQASFQEISLGDEASVGDFAPDWALTLASGGTISSRELRGSVVVLYFWASWCPSCHRFMPAVQGMHDAFGGRVRVFAVNAFDRDDALAHIRERGYTFEVALNGDELLTTVFGFPGQPAMVVLDREGVVRYRALAEDPGNEALWALLGGL